MTINKNSCNGRWVLKSTTKNFDIFVFQLILEIDECFFVGVFREYAERIFYSRKVKKFNRPIIVQGPILIHCNLVKLLTIVKKRF
jgi:hypothetical protein